MFKQLATVTVLASLLVLPAHRVRGAAIPAATLPRLGGLNLAGFDFGCTTDGTCKGSSSYPQGWVQPPLSQPAHFSSEGANFYRIPFGWQYMTPTLGGTLDSSFFSTYDSTVKNALASSANTYVIIDVHNYARWNGGIINQGGPTNAQFASLWTQLATKYANNNRVLFGLMNEPHDLDMTKWAATVQYVVTAIRQAGANNYISIPGTDYTSMQTFPTNSGPYLNSVTDPAGKIIYEVHKYLDSDNSGTQVTCTQNNVNYAQTFVQYLQANGHQAILAETGGSNDQSCLSLLAQELSYIKGAYPTIIGFATWSAGAFGNTDSAYDLTEVPQANGQDQRIFAQAVQPNLPGTAASGPPPTTSTPPPTTTTTTTSTPPPTSTPPSTSCAAKYGQCGGQGWAGATCCQSGSTCKVSNPYYSQCL